ncbi:hypothetical protein K2173_018001 [Erythroxylum novogranatense]|uniref:Uncharacterized protein n=1 Tax=Erythroxylum novogranatense TaxID=1862640 RepID=A0AAV8TWG1_9ROSI|nr:hypothetical protein K2173_018001 [Erythroxylum novogranatense]
MLASDLGVDSMTFLAAQETEGRSQRDIEEDEAEAEEKWHHCSWDLFDFYDLDILQFFPSNGKSLSLSDWFCSNGNWGVVEEVHSPQICSELPEGPFCIVYMRSTVQKEKKIPCITILRWLYEEKVYFIHIHPRLHSRLAFATLGWFFLIGGLYWKIKYVNHLYRDDVLQRRPLTDYGTELDPFHLNEIPVTAYSLGRYEDRWASREYFSFYTWEADHIQALAELESQEGWND